MSRYACDAGRRVSRDDDDWREPCPGEGTNQIVMADEGWSAYLCERHVRLLAAELGPGEMYGPLSMN